MGNVIKYDEYVNNRERINESPEASVFVICDYLTYAVKHINLSNLEPKDQEDLVNVMDGVLNGLKELLNNNDIQGNKFYCFNPEFSGRSEIGKQG